MAGGHSFSAYRQHPTHKGLRMLAPTSVRPSVKRAGDCTGGGVARITCHLQEVGPRCRPKGGAMAWWLPKPNSWARKRGCQERREAPKEGEKGLALRPRGFSGIRKLPRKVSTSALLGRWHNPTWPSCPGGWVSPERYRPSARLGHRGKVPGAQQGSYP